MFVVCVVVFFFVFVVLFVVFVLLFFFFVFFFFFFFFFCLFFLFFVFVFVAQSSMRRMRCNQQPDPRKCERGAYVDSYPPTHRHSRSDPAAEAHGVRLPSPGRTAN